MIEYYAIKNILSTSLYFIYVEDGKVLKMYGKNRGGIWQSSVALRPSELSSLLIDGHWEVVCDLTEEEYRQILNSNGSIWDQWINENVNLQ